MGAAEHAALARRWAAELLSAGRLGLIDELVGETLAVGPERTPVADAPRRVRLYVTAYRQAFPDLTMKVDELLATEETVTLCWTCHGTHTGHFSHPDIQSFGIPPTGRAARWSGVTVFWFRDGRIARLCTGQDVYGLLRQLELVPALASGAAS
jgi:steroid delta-isomerase-like uncharacterized protein